MDKTDDKNSRAISRATFNDDAIEPGLKYPKGFVLIQTGTCPVGAKFSASCMVCAYGHILECHFPNDCATAKCLHLAAYDTHEPLEKKANA